MGNYNRMSEAIQHLTVDSSKIMALCWKSGRITYPFFTHEILGRPADSNQLLKMILLKNIILLLMSCSNDFTHWFHSNYQIENIGKYFPYRMQGFFFAFADLMNQRLFGGLCGRGDS